MQVKVRTSGLAGSEHEQHGEATYIGKAQTGEDLYRVVFGGPEFERSSVFRASDLSFVSASRRGGEG